VIFEDAMFARRQSTLADKAEIGDELLIFQAPDGTALAAGVCF
jgi:hypothetical protein